MIKIYRSDEVTNDIITIDNLEDIKKGCWINIVDPTEDELVKVENATGANHMFLRYALDLEESSRIDTEDDQVLILIDAPINEDNNITTIDSTIPLGMIIVRNDYLITISRRTHEAITEFEDGTVKGLCTYKKTRFIFQIMYKISKMYIKSLIMINKETDTAETELQVTMKNELLIKLLNIQKSLVYFSTSIKSNGIVMDKLMRGNIITLYEEDKDMLDDTIIENKQAMEMANTYSNVLSSMMDAYASIISNNLNIVMKLLAGLTIVLAIPTIIGGLFGMNVVMPHFFAGPNAFVYIIVGTITLSASVLLLLRKLKMI